MNTDFAAQALDNAIALQKVRACCENILANNPTPSNDWGEGYRQCELDFAEGILLILNGEDKRSCSLPSCR